MYILFIVPAVSLVLMASVEMWSALSSKSNS
jgi:hypothetical protein